MIRARHFLPALVAIPTLVLAADPVVLDPLDSPAASSEILETWTSAPHDSLVIRLSLAFGEAGADHVPYLVIEEMIAPRPLRFWLDGDTPPPDPHRDDFDRILRVDGRALINGAAGLQPNTQNMRSRYNPAHLRFGGWLSAHEFVVITSHYPEDVPLLISRDSDGHYTARSTAGPLSFDLPVESLSAPLMSADVVRMTTGPASGSLVLRVTLERYPGRCCSSHGIVIEELGWPPPGVARMRSPNYDPATTTCDRDQDRWLRGGRLDQDALHAIWQATPRDPRALWGHIMPGYEFKTWLAPGAFAVGNGDLSLVVGRTGEGVYEFREVLGNRMK